MLSQSACFDLEGEEAYTSVLIAEDSTLRAMPLLTMSRLSWPTMGPPSMRTR